MPRDLFDMQVSENEADPRFLIIRDHPYKAAAKRLMREVFDQIDRPEKQFIKDFQSRTGFSSRTFELALHGYFQEQSIELDTSRNVPDYLTKGNLPVAIEATTANPPQDSPIDLDTPFIQQLREIEDESPETFVFQMAKAIARKVQKKDKDGLHYWEQPCIKGKPFVIAVASFYNIGSYMYSFAYLANYLYGRTDIAHQDDQGRLVLEPRDITEHVLDGRPLPSRFFRKNLGKHVSGILFSNQHTAAKFTRIGAERGYDHGGSSIVRWGHRAIRDPNATGPEPFVYIIGDRPADALESFSEGLELLINPWAHVPLPPDALPGINTHRMMNNGLLVSSTQQVIDVVASQTEQHPDRGSAIQRCLGIRRDLGIDA